MTTDPKHWSSRVKVKYDIELGLKLHEMAGLDVRNGSKRPNHQALIVDVTTGKVIDRGHNNEMFNTATEIAAEMLGVPLRRIDDDEEE